MFMNSMEIDEAVDTLTRRNSPVLRYAHYLATWRDIVDAHSDGWHSWPGGARAAEGLQRLVQQEVAHRRPLFSELNRALAPIKACATRRGLPHPILNGGTR